MPLLILVVALLLGVPAALAAQVAEPAPTRVDSLEDVSVLLDTGAVRRALLLLPENAERRRSTRTYVVSYDTAGAPRRVVLAAPDVAPDEERDAIIAALRAGMRPIPPRRPGPTVQLLVTTGAGARVEVVRLEEQPVRVADLLRLRRQLEREASDLVSADESLLGRTLRVRIALRVRVSGEVEEAWVEVSSGDAAIDAAALRIAGVTRFTPAILDGDLVPARAVLPLTFVFPDED